MKKTTCTLAILLTTIFAHLAFARRLYPPNRPERISSFEQTGIASWYGEHEAGRRTYSDDIFNPHALTCAHRTLPMYTIISVTNIVDGKSTQCTVNDRGPFVRGRIVDLSEQVASQIGIIKSGVVKVSLVVLSMGYWTRPIHPNWKPICRQKEQHHFRNHKKMYLTASN